MTVKIMIDSASDFTKEQATQLGLIFMPISVQFGGKEYLDGVDLSAEEFYNKLESCTELPRTSLINEYCWSEAFERETADGAELVVITISSKLSGTYEKAVEASKRFGGRVHVVDSFNAAFGEGVLGLYALELRNKGLSAQEIEDNLNQRKKDVRIYAVIDTLKYLRKGGRISATTAIVGTTLSIKPIVAIIDGEVKMVGKAMGNKRGNLMLNSIVQSEGGIDFSMPFSYIWSGKDKSNIEKFIKDSQGLVESHDVTLQRIGCTIGTHAGAGAVGIVFFKKN